MAAPKRFAIPSISEMEKDNGSETDKGHLFKRHKESKDITDVESLGNQPDTTKTQIEINETKTVSSVERGNGVGSKQSTLESRTESTGNDNIPTTETSNPSQSSTLAKPGSSNSLIVNPRQRGNPILKFVRNVPWEYGNIVPDYVLGPTNCALFLSLRYHQLHPNYIHDRLKSLGHSYELRVMLVQVDVKESHHLLKDLAKICLLADCTLILAFSTEEAGRYLETYKVFENKPAEAIMERTEDNYMAKFVDCLTRVKSVNKTDCATLLTAFGSLSNIMEAKEDDLCLCPGFGPQKAKRLRSIFQEPFLRNVSKVQDSKDNDFDGDGS